MTLEQAYHKLIDDTIHYLQLQCGENFDWNVNITKPKTVIPKPKPITKPAPQLEPQNTPAIKKEKPLALPPVEAEKSEISFRFEPPEIPKTTSHEAMRSLMTQIAPELFLHETAPTDLSAKRIKEGWKERYATPEVPILLHGKNHLKFLTQIAKAIDTCFFPSRIVPFEHLEKEKKWDLFLESQRLKLIIAPDHVLFGSKGLLPYYTENPNEKTRFLGKIPLLLLPDLSLYMKDPSLKRSLWNVICQALSPQSS